MVLKEIGEVEIKRYDAEAEIKWKIDPDFLLEFYFYDCKSPDFSFGNIRWHLEMHDYNDVCRRDILLYLCSDFVREYSVEYSFGLVKRDRSVEQFMKGILKGNQERNLRCQAIFMRYSELRERESEFILRRGLLTVSGRLKFEIASSLHPSVSDKRKLENLISLDTLSENLRRIFVNKDNCDTTLHVADKEYKAHRAILIAGSSVFAAMFQHETSEKQSGIITIPDCEPESFEKFLEFLYTGKLEEPSLRNALHLYETSEKYNIQELKAFCAEYLMQNLTLEIFCDVVALADKYDEENLLSAAQKFFNENCSEILDTFDWDSLVKNNYRLSKKLLKEMCRK